MLVVAVVGFLIVLAALFLVNLGGYSERDICKLSVLTRATAPSAVQAAVPLKCKTSKICLTESYFGGGCKEQFAGEENVEYVRLSGDPSQKARQIEEVSANAMYDCWSMMGEGKLDLFGEFFGNKDATCVVCSRVAIDKAVKEEVLNLVDVDNYMKTYQVPGSSLTYLQTFTDKGVSSYASFDAKASNALDEKKPGEQKFAVNKYYDVAYVFSQIKSKEVVSVLMNMGIIGGTLGAATFATPIIGGVAKKLIITPVGLTLTAVAVVGAAGYGTYMALDSQKSAAGYCGKYTSMGKQSEVPGCSVVQAVPYNFNDVNGICGAIQGEL
jgi:hypothetical protein